MEKVQPKVSKRTEEMKKLIKVLKTECQSGKITSEERLELNGLSE